MNKRRLLMIIAIVVVAVVLVIVFDMILANHRPVIAGLEAQERVVPSGSCQIVCSASDRDGDPLSYNWSASGGSISGTGTAVNWTAPEEAGSYNVTVTVTDSRGEEVTRQVVIQVRANNPPTIVSLTADAEWTTPSGSVQVACTASDPDGDELTYEWTVTAGDISGAGAAVNWTAPASLGVHNITVVVEDRHGSEDAMSVPLSVALGTPPAIENLMVNPKGHIYLRECTVAGCDYDVWKAKEYEIACNVSDTSDGVIYVWSCTEGEITGEGSTITWTAPTKTLVKATVTVVVCDAAGNSVGRNIIFHVPICTCGSW